MKPTYENRLRVAFQDAVVGVPDEDIESIYEFIRFMHAQRRRRETGRELSARKSCCALEDAGVNPLPARRPGATLRNPHSSVCTLDCGRFGCRLS